jgi:hypothetical protein
MEVVRDYFRTFGDDCSAHAGTGIHSARRGSLAIAPPMPDSRSNYGVMNRLNLEIHDDSGRAPGWAIVAAIGIGRIPVILGMRQRLGTQETA